MHLKRCLWCIVFLYSTRPKIEDASAHWFEQNITSRSTIETTSSKYRVFIFNLTKASERQRALVRTSVIYMHLERRLRCFVFLFSDQSQWTPMRTDCENISMHLKRRLRCIVFLYSTRPKPVNASAHWWTTNITSRKALGTTSSMYSVFVFNPVSRNVFETTSSMYWFSRFNLAKASERQRTLIVRKDHMQECVWNDVFVFWYSTWPPKPVHASA